MTGDLVLVTGARGFIGWHLSKYLLRTGAQVRGLTRSLAAPLPETDPGIEWFEGDLKRQSDLHAAVKDCRILFHVGADYRFWAPDNREIYASNIDGTSNILDAAERAGVEKIIYTSTSGILAHKKEGEQTETELASPNQLRGPYKRSKLLAYREIEKRAQQGWPIVTVLPTAPIGPCDLRPTPTGRIILEFLKGHIPMYANTGLNFVDVRDVAIGHHLASNRGISGQRYLIGCQNLWLREFLARLEPFTRYRAPKIAAPYWLSKTIAHISEGVAQFNQREPFAALEAVETSRFPHFFSSSKAISEIGYDPQGIDLAIREAVQYFQDRGMT
jgi:dihydroflavonol-4-reductase